MSQQIIDQEKKNIKGFIEIIKMIEVSNISRGTIIDLLNLENNKDLWKYTIKALVIGKSEHLIHKYYLLDKLDFCKDNIKTPYIFLDIFRYNIFHQLCLLDGINYKI